MKDYTAIKCEKGQLNPDLFNSIPHTFDNCKVYPYSAPYF